MSTPPGSCPRCGAPYTPGQEYCLECGLRLPSATRVSRFQGRRWYPGDWVWPVLVFLLLAGLGALIAILATRDTNDRTNVALPPPPATTGGGGIGTTPPPTTTAPPPTTTAPPPTTTAAPPANRIISWPDRSGYTIVLASIPTTSGRAQANAAARRALRAGLTQVGVLTSSSYPSLQPGYYVVFTGVYGTDAEAESHLSAARSAGFSNPYVKPVTT